MDGLADEHLATSVSKADGLLSYGPERLKIASAFVQHKMDIQTNPKTKSTAMANGRLGHRII